MKDYLAAIIQRIKETAQYNSMSYHAIVESAVEVEAIEDLDDRKIARKKFRKYNDLTSQVWAKIPARFPNYKDCKTQVIRALSYMCQLPKAECWDLYIAHKDHLDETNAHLRVRDDVDVILDAKRKPSKPRAKKENTMDETINLLRELSKRAKPFAVRDVVAQANAAPTEAQESADWLIDQLEIVDAALAAREKAVK